MTSTNRNSQRDTTKETEKQFVDILHESLINYRVISDPRVIQWNILLKGTWLLRI